ncbi:Homeobox-leucine zipper protein HAT14-like protein [Drosera capensis]
MELALSLGETSKPFPFIDKPQPTTTTTTKDLTGFCMTLALSGGSGDRGGDKERVGFDEEAEEEEEEKKRVSEDAVVPPPVSPLQLDLLPFSPVSRTVAQGNGLPRFPWLAENCLAMSSEPGSADGEPGSRGLILNRFPAAGATKVGDEVDEESSPNSAVSSFVGFSLYRNSGSSGGGDRRNGKRAESGGGGEAEKENSRASDDDENGSTRKKLRLSKEQSAFLEESFKEHHTLNPKQKQALAKQLNLRPRQVEVWFQNRRARTKLKQTEVDCEYLKRCCETLTEENRRLQKELQELRALKASQPFYTQLPATTLTMCPSCERVATVSNGTANSNAT